ncbi:MAG: sigma 54-dependent transcriptional regulator, partial [bacterium]|nr:sigma 54-dependent transcriptional regulator [bacterium]
LKTAEEGIVFLDEIGELGLDEQAMLLRAIEEKRFMPMGADTEVESDFQLICGTNRDLFDNVEKGEFREDLLARINLWTFKMPGLKDRPDDIGPNLEFELKQYEERSGIHFTFSKEARETFMRFAVSPQALWKSNFRDLNGAVIRMCTLAPGGRITLEVCREEIERLKERWKTNDDSFRPGHSRGSSLSLDDLISSGQLEQLDPFDYVQLAYVVDTCRNTRSLSEAGRLLFAHSRLKKNKPNDTDRLKKYLAKFGLSWADVTDHKR